jgi:hypothetical protein
MYTNRYRPKNQWKNWATAKMICDALDRKAIAVQNGHSGFRATSRGTDASRAVRLVRLRRTDNWPSGMKVGVTSNFHVCKNQVLI